MATNKTATRGNPREKRHHKPGWKTIFLAELEKWGVVDHAVHVAGVHPATAYEARKNDPKFAAEWDRAKGKIVGTMEVVARQRALLGTTKPIYHQGQKIDTVQEMDNVHLRWLLSKLKPAVYGDKIEHTGPAGKPIQHEHHVSGQIDVKTLSDEQLNSLRDILTAPAVPEDGRDRDRQEEPA